MANIGATTAFYKVETSLTRANNEVSKSMERLATGKANANAGDRSSYVAMADTFRLDFVGTKAGIKGASVVMGYLETGMRVLDSASALLSRLQELAILGANDTNTDADALAINAEAEAIADEFHRLMSTSTYKGKDIFVDTANSEYVSMGGRDSEMNFGLGRVEYSNLYLHDYQKLFDENAAEIEAVLTATTGGSTFTAVANANDKIFNAKKYLSQLASDGMRASGTSYTDTGVAVIVQGADYEVVTAFSANADVENFGNSGDTLLTDTGTNGSAYTVVSTDGGSGATFTASASGKLAGTGHVAKGLNQLVFAASEGMYHTTPDTNLLSNEIEDVQAKINTARVQAGSQYAALESAVNYTTDLTAQYELGYNTVNDVNFSMETAHLAKNQILQQAATAMLAQANEGQQGLLQLIQR